MATRTGLSTESGLVQSLEYMLQRILVLEMVVEKPVRHLGKVRIQFKGMRQLAAGCLQQAENRYLLYRIIIRCCLLSAAS